MGTRGLLILLDGREDALEEGIDEEIELLTQTLLARDELDGWPGLRPKRGGKRWSATCISEPVS